MIELLSLDELEHDDVADLVWGADWARCAKRLFSTVSAGLGEPVALSSQSVREVLTCSGWWESRREFDQYDLPADGVKVQVVRAIVRRWLAANLDGGQQVRPLLFAGQVLRRFSDSNSVFGRWVRLLSSTELAEFRSEVAVLLARLDVDWQQRNRSLSVVPGSLLSRARFGSLALTSNVVDATIGAASLSGSGFVAGSTLLSFASSPSLSSQLDELGVAAVLHGLRTGCPPARIVMWDLVSGSGVAQTVDNDFVSLWCQQICEATRRISEIQSFFEPRLHGGPHCQKCPNFEYCPNADRDEYAW